MEEDEAFTTGLAYDSWVSSIFGDVIANGLPYVFGHHQGADPAFGGSTSLTCPELVEGRADLPDFTVGTF